MTIVTPDHVKLRLEDAGRTLMMLPVPKGEIPTGFAGVWPDVMVTTADWFAANVGADKDLVRSLHKDRNQFRLQASSGAIQRMEEAFEWLWYVEDQRHRRIVAARALVHPLAHRHIATWKKLAEIHNMTIQTMCNWHSEGLLDIAAALSTARATA